jgi:hypothetical protein
MTAVCLACGVGFLAAQGGPPAAVVRSLRWTGEPSPAPRHPLAGTLTCGDYAYQGEWADDAMHGQGAFAFASGASYRGGWRAGVYEGQGRYTWPDGSYYEARTPMACVLEAYARMCICLFVVVCVGGRKW